MAAKIFMVNIYIIAIMIYSRCLNIWLLETHIFVCRSFAYVEQHALYNVSPRDHN